MPTKPLPVPHHRLPTLLSLLSLLHTLLAASSDIVSVTLTMDHFSVNGTGTPILFEKGLFYFNEPSVQQAFMRPDLSSCLVIVGLARGVNKEVLNDWGVNCLNDTAESNCEYTVTNDTTVKYLNYTYDSYDIEIANPLKNDKSYNLATKLAAYGLYDSEDSGSKLFALGDTGVMGLGLKSHYFENLFDHYAFEDDTFVFSFEYNLDKSHAWWEENTYAYLNTSSLTLNGYNKGSLLASSDLFNSSVSKSYKFWQIPSVSLNVGNSTLISSSMLCITNAQNAIISTLPKYNLSEAINQAFCKSSTSCDGTLSLDSAPTLSLQFENFGLTLNPEDYMYKAEQNGPFESAVNSNLTAWINQGICSPESTIAVGRLFFAKYAIIFFYSQNDNHQISFGIKKERRELTSKERAILVGICIGMIVIIFVTMVAKTIYDRRKNPKSEKQGWTPVSPKDRDVQRDGTFRDQTDTILTQ